MWGKVIGVRKRTTHGRPEDPTRFADNPHDVRPALVATSLLYVFLPCSYLIPKQNASCSGTPAAWNDCLAKVYVVTLLVWRLCMLNVERGGSL